LGLAKINGIDKGLGATFVPGPLFEQGVLTSATGNVEFPHLQTKALQGILNSHSEFVMAIAPPPEGQLLASSSCDTTVTLRPQRPLNFGHISCLSTEQHHLRFRI
jgi:WD40 repeat protein